MNTLAEINQANAEFHGRKTADAEEGERLGGNKEPSKEAMRPAGGEAPPPLKNRSLGNFAGTARSRARAKAKEIYAPKPAKDVSHGPRGEQQIKRGGKVVVQHDVSLKGSGTTASELHEATKKAAAKTAGYYGGQAAAAVKKYGGATSNSPGVKNMATKAAHFGKIALGQDGGYAPATNMSVGDLQRANDAKYAKKSRDSAAVPFEARDDWTNKGGTKPEHGGYKVGQQVSIRPDTGLSKAEFKKRNHTITHVSPSTGLVRTKTGQVFAHHHLEPKK